MKCALVCIARNEDRYIDEWIQYHLKLGFDNIFVFCDKWKYTGEHYPGVRVFNIKIEGVPPQIPTYNFALSSFGDKYDWIAFFDVDEFLVLKKHASIHEFLADKHDSIGVNWKLFGDNGLAKDDGSMGVLSRFTKCQSTPNHHVKAIVKCNIEDEMATPHNPNHLWLGSDGIFHEGPYCPDGNTDEAQLNHYFCKTRAEFKLKQDRGGADGYYRRPDSDFDRHNFNEVEDFSARDFLYPKNLEKHD
jgi:hypothetical protein